ncbi:MAG: MarR family winged helix-turn-helix transcriptional regulator [Burkholderiaceae bacterium]
MKKAAGARSLSKHDIEALSEFRYQLRRFLRFSEDAAKDEGITPLQYQLLLHVKGFPGREEATIGELAERLQSQHHGAVSLVSRCEAADLVVRVPGTRDRREVLVRLTEEGERRLHRLAARHRDELKSLTDVFELQSLSNFNDRR